MAAPLLCVCEGAAWVFGAPDKAAQETCGEIQQKT